MLSVPERNNRRYQDGRKMWSNIITSSRNLAQQIWLHVPTDRTGLKGSETTVLQNVIEKKTMINLVCRLLFVNQTIANQNQRYSHLLLLSRYFCSMPFSTETILIYVCLRSTSYVMNGASTMRTSILSSPSFQDLQTTVQVTTRGFHFGTKTVHPSGQLTCLPPNWDAMAMAQIPRQGGGGR